MLFLCHREKSRLRTPLGTSLSNMVWYHLGSVALGSLLIALVQLARVILKFLQSKLKGAQSDMAQCLLKACQCCLYCFEKFLAYLTRNAFIEVGKFFHLLSVLVFRLTEVILLVIVTLSKKIKNKYFQI